MDPLTHCVIGSISAKAVKASPRRFWIMTLLGSAPDLDVLMNVFGGWAAIFQHRGITHSFIGLFAQAVFYAVLLRRWDTGSFKERALHYSLPIAFHVFCDYLTSYGVPLLSPFTLTNYSWDLIGSLNLVPLAITIAGLWWLHKKEAHGWKATTPLWAVWAVYFGLAFSGRAYAAHLTSYPTATMVPSIVNPFGWRAVAVDESHHAYRHYDVNILKGNVTFLGASQQPGREFPVEKSLKSALVQEFLHDHRWPVVRVIPTDGQWRVEWGTLIYSVRGMARGKVAVQIAADGRILSEENIISYWNPELLP